ncbi:MAG: 2Fe-2S iron-sulfur cluster binding domain-containing protein [Gammaproteobacteria bacterium]|nr:2Fe-2S iron-sulfur cluster binding domain-containing protein [Gammaproteobacteria bacterium]
MSTRFHPLTILRVSPQTEHAVCVELMPAPQARSLFDFEQGQYLTLQADIDGQPCTRSYSICSRRGEMPLSIAIKRIEGGHFSTWAQTGLQPGQQVLAMPPAGSFNTALDPGRRRRYLCVAAGSGITPILSNLRTILHEEPLSELTLVYGNQRTASIMFKEELSFVKNRYMSRFHWINVLSREVQDAQVLNGRIDNRKGAELVRARLIDIAHCDEFFLCGPQAMIAEVSRGLRAEGVAQAHIHYELFHASADDARTVIRKHQARAALHAGHISRVRVTLDGRSTIIEVGADGENLLDAALAAGLDAPFGCKGGVCATCKSRLVSGEVEMDLDHALSDEQIASGLILTCQSHPVSDSVHIDFDAV